VHREEAASAEEGTLLQMREIWGKLAGKAPENPVGIYNYRGEGQFAGLSLQLRIEKGGNGLLLINANTVLYLNETATAHAHFFVKGLSTEEAVKQLRKTYRIGAEEAKKDHERTIYTISTLAQTEEICPISYLDVRQVEPFSQELSAPIRVDLALTFRCQNKCVHCYTGGSREIEELTTEQWKKTMDKLFSLGVFIFTFTGGEPTLREDLAELLSYAQKKGAVSGLITNGRRLSDPEYVQRLAETGLDFAQVTIESHKPSIHDRITGVKGSWKETVQAIRNILPTPVYLTTNTTLNRYNADSFLETIAFLKTLGVERFACNSLIYSGKGPEVSEKFSLPVEQLKALLPRIRAKAEELDMKFSWYTPTQYCQLNPVSIGLGIKSCTAARVNMCIGPDGTVYPCQSYFESLGNILTDAWEKIWNNPLAVSVRNREYVPSKCGDCPEFYVCGGGCPLELRNKSYLCTGSG